MDTVIIIQARLGSSRLPCKSLLLLHELPIIDWVVRRCDKSRLANKVVVAIPEGPRDDVLASHLHKQGTCVWRGPEQDVLARMVGAANAFDAQTVVRVCADNPLVWGPEIDHLIRFFHETDCDYSSNHIPRDTKYPNGFGGEIVSADLLRKAALEATLPAHREHCLSYITDQPNIFRMATFDPPDPAMHRPELGLDVDTASDFIALARLRIHSNMAPVEVIHAIDAAEPALKDELSHG